MHLIIDMTAVPGGSGLEHFRVLIRSIIVRRMGIVEDYTGDTFPIAIEPHLAEVILILVQVLNLVVVLVIAIVQSQ